MIRGVFRPELMRSLVDTLEQSPTFQADDITTNFNMWMELDELLDFYTYGPLGSIAAHFFSSPDAKTSSLPPSAQLIKDFKNVRGKDKGTGWHVDMGECSGDLPAMYTARALPRLVVPLIREGGVEATQVLNQSMYSSAMSKTEASSYWKGDLPHRLETRFEELWGYNRSMTLPILPGLQLDESMIVGGRLEVGDIMVFNTCLWHRTPPWDGKGEAAFLQPTFGPSSHIPFKPLSWTDLGGSHCDHALPAETIGEVSSPCYPYAFPEEKRPKAGTELAFRRVPKPKIRHCLPGLIKSMLKNTLSRLLRS